MAFGRPSIIGGTRGGRDKIGGQEGQAQGSSGMFRGTTFAEPAGPGSDAPHAWLWDDRPPHWPATLEALPSFAILSAAIIGEGRSCKAIGHRDILRTHTREKAPPELHTIVIQPFTKILNLRRCTFLSGEISRSATFWFLARLFLQQPT